MKVHFCVFYMNYMLHERHENIKITSCSSASRQSVWAGPAATRSVLSAPRHGLDYTAPEAAGSSANLTAH